MLEFKVNGRLIDIDDTTTVSLSYQLTNKNDPSSFTTVYSSSVNIPLTRGNRIVFGFPDVLVSDLGSYKYSLYKNGTELDAGSLVVNEVTDSYVTCNLYSSAVSLSSLLGGDGKRLGDFVTDEGYDKNGVLKDVVTKADVQADNFTADVPNENQGEVGLNLVRLQDHADGFLYFYAANIGKPKDFDVRTEWDGTNYTDMNRGDVGILQAPKYDVGGSWYYQYRTYQLTPVVPMMTIFRNVLGSHVVSDAGFNVSISSDVVSHLNNIGYVGPSLKTVCDWELKDRDWVKGVDKETSGAISRGVIGVKDMLMSTNGYAGNVIKNDGDVVTECFYTVHLLVNGVEVSSKLVYPDNQSEYKIYNNLFGGSYTASNSCKYSSGLSLIFDGIQSGATYKVRVDSHVAVYTKQFASYVVSTSSYNNVLLFADDITTQYDYDVWFLMQGVDSPVMSIKDYFNAINNPWGIVKGVCKKFNIRIKQLGVQRFELVFTDDYYGNTRDISRYVDVKDKKIANHYFDSKYLLFRDEPIDSAWLKKYKDSYDDYYGRAKLGTNYPVVSTEEWFGDKLKYMCTPKTYVFRYPGELTNTVIDMIGEAYDEDGNEIDVVGCLCDMTPSAYDIERDSMLVALCDDNSDYSHEQCYYADGYVSTVCTTITVPKLRTCDVNGMELLMYGPSQSMPTGSSIKDNVNVYFRDVLDSAYSKTVTMKVDIYKMKVSVYEFVTGVYCFDNAYWVVAEIKSYNLGVDKMTDVTFLKVRDLTNYK